MAVAVAKRNPVENISDFWEEVLTVSDTRHSQIAPGNCSDCSLISVSTES